jgi:hypothetical protein
MSQLFFTPQAVRINSAGTPYAGAKANFYLTGTTTRTNTYTDSARSVAHDNPVVADSAGQFAPIYLVPSTTYRCVITDSADVQLDDVDPIGTPLTASDILVVDAGGYYAGTEVEAVLQDIGLTYGKKTATGTWSADQTFSAANLLMADNLITRPEIKDYSVTHNVISSSSGTLTIDCSTGNSFVTTLTEVVSTVTITNPSPTGKYCEINIKIIQDGASGAYTVAWPAAVLFPGGTDIVISTANDAIDVVTMFTIDAGTTWHANFSQAYA